VMLRNAYAGKVLYCFIFAVMAACGGGATKPDSSSDDDDNDNDTIGSGGRVDSGTGGRADGAGGGSGDASGGRDASGGAETGTGGGDSATGGGSTDACPTAEEETFSFFLISRDAIVYYSKSEDGFGGDLGGLQGADALCQATAEAVSPCQKNKVWRAFLSTSSENAIDRIGAGPWYDRMGRLFANNLQELLYERPQNANAEIKNDFPNEFGITNHNPTATPGAEVDNHEILTGTGENGTVYSQQNGGWGMGTTCGDNEDWTVEKATCWDWTSSLPEGCPRVGHSWPGQSSGAHWISVWNEGGCAPGGVLSDSASLGGGPDGTRRVGSAGGYGAFYCFALLSGDG
jgi:hypothetical protein